MKTIAQLSAEYIAQAEKEIAEHEAIYNILKELNGKVFDSRTLNKKRLGEFQFDKRYGMFHIKGIVEHLVGYDSNPYIDSEAFRKFDACYGEANQKRIDNLKTMDSEKLQTIQNKIAEHFNGIIEQFKILDRDDLDSYHNPIYYQMLREVYDGENSTRAKINMSDFYYLAKYGKEQTNEKAD